MKKILMLFLLAFPLLIFAIVLWSSTVISYYLKLPVTGIDLVSNIGENIEVDTLNQTSDLQFQIYPASARNLSFKIYDDENRLLASYQTGDQAPYIYTELDDPDYLNAVVSLEVPAQNQFMANGKGFLRVISKNYGFTRLTIETEDGKYRAYSDVFVYDDKTDPKAIQGVVLNYQKHDETMQFGSLNEIDVAYTFFPKRAVKYQTEEERVEIDQALREQAESILWDLSNGSRVIQNESSLDSQGTGMLKVRLEEGSTVLKTEGLKKNASFSFQAHRGYNIYDETMLRSLMNQDEALYIMKEIKITNFVVFENQTIYGNDFRLDLSGMKDKYDQVKPDGSMDYVGAIALKFKGDKTFIDHLNVLGPLNQTSASGGVPYENIINVGIYPENKGNHQVVIQNSVIENGRFNLSLVGKARYLDNRFDGSSYFKVEHVTLIGGAIASLEIDNSKERANAIVSSDVTITGLEMAYTGIGIVIQNAQDDKGMSKTHFIDQGEVKSLISENWRNIDDASGALSANNFGYIIGEMKKYTDVIYQDGADSYVNAVIMLRGGQQNYSELDFSQTTVLEDLVLKKRTPNLIEAMHPMIGGTRPFEIYLMDPKFYVKKG